MDYFFTQPSIITTISVSISIFLIGLILGRILGRLTQKIMSIMHIDTLILHKKQKTFSIQMFLGEIVSIITYAIFTIIALNYIGITTILISIVLGIIVLIVLISTVLSLRDSLPNIFGYYRIVKQNKLSIGDTISIANTNGTIVSLSIYEIQIETKNKNIIFIPNRLLAKEKLTIHKR